VSFRVHQQRTATVARSAALLSLGALAVHQLRYAAAFGDRAGAALASEGHAYLTGAIPPLAAMAVATIAAAVLTRGLGGSAGAAAPLWRRGAAYACALLVVFASQELAEGALAAGHPAGLAGVFGEGGWLAIPLSAAIGAATAFLASLLDRAEDGLGRRVRRREARPARAPRAIRPTAGGRRRPALASRPLAFGLARRPPPLAPGT
jgi:hypothetical protein